MENKTEFKVGDIVEAFGCRGVVSDIDDAVSGRSISVTFDCDRNSNYYFYHDGKQNDWHKEPSLKLIERPKQKKKVMMYPAVFQNSVIFESPYLFIADKLFETEDDAKKSVTIAIKFICLLKNQGVEIEVEE